MSFLFGTPAPTNLTPISMNPIHGGPLLQWMASDPRGFSGAFNQPKQLSKMKEPTTPLPHGTIDQSTIDLISMFSEPKGQPVTVPEAPAPRPKTLLEEIFGLFK